jgi:hypothetical protein
VGRTHLADGEDPEQGRGVLLRRRPGHRPARLAKLQYWNGSAYADVPGASGYPLAKIQYNSVSFTATGTTRLRVLPTGNGTSSVGLLEAKVFGP